MTHCNACDGPTIQGHEHLDVGWLGNGTKRTLCCECFDEAFESVLGPILFTLRNVDGPA